ncbi:uncharacterized protein DS421_9g276850 [Arachis hypogaea]|nr:uncharacterized protein DS421_9g276850 [Arachis hypogaea]
MLVYFQKQNNGGKEAAAVDGSPSMRRRLYFYLQASHFSKKPSLIINEKKDEVS